MQSLIPVEELDRMRRKRSAITLSVRYLPVAGNRSAELGTSHLLEI